MKKIEKVELGNDDTPSLSAASVEEQDEKRLVSLSKFTNREHDVESAASATGIARKKTVSTNFAI